MGSGEMATSELWKEQNVERTRNTFMASVTLGRLGSHPIARIIIITHLIDILKMMSFK